MTRGGSRRVGDRYLLDELIGRGGAGTVWRAHDELLEREVAIKEVAVAPNLPDDERHTLRRRVLREARAAARLDHSAAVTIYDVIQEDGNVLIVMELVRAPNLEEVVRRGGVFEDRVAAELGLAVLDALEVAHSRGIVHRDVKPSNVLVPDDGRVRLTDFGIASLADDVNLTRSGRVLGSPAYVSPEQARGDKAGPAADLWGLGATLYFAVEGQAPFDRNEALATVHAVVHEPYRSPERADALVPVIGRLLDKDPEQRPDVSELRGLLEQVQAGRRPDSGGGSDADSGTTRILPGIAAGTAGTADTGPRQEDGGDTSDREPAVGVGRESAAATSAGGGAGASGVAAGSVRSNRRAATGLAVLAVAAIAVIGGVVWLLSGLGDEDAPGGVAGGEAPGPAASPTTDEAPDPGDDPETGRPTDQGTSSPPANTPGRPTTDSSPTPTGQNTVPEVRPTIPDTIPERWATYEGSGYSVPHPPDWQPEGASGRQVDITDPETGAYLRLDSTDEPAADVLENSQGIADTFAENHADYRQVRLEPTSYRGNEAAIWEYTYHDDGADLHAVHLNISTGDRGYALNFQTHAEDWESMNGLFDLFTDGFRTSD